MSEFLKYSEMIVELKKTNSKIKKTEIMQRMLHECEIVVNYALDPFKMYNITSKQINISVGDDVVKWEDTRELLNFLLNRELVGKAAISRVNSLLDGCKEEFITSFMSIIDKDMKSGISAKSVNKVSKNLVPEFSCQLCDKYIPEKHKGIVMLHSNEVVRLIEASYR